MSGPRQAYFLVGPTAVGKTAVAHTLARRRGAAILSADSMLVYREMDIGTAKPTVAERGEVPYFGVDLAAPDEDFSVWAYCARVAAELRATDQDQPLIVAGGTGLYVKALIDGLDTGPAPDPAVRAHWTQRFEDEGVSVLQEELRARAPRLFNALADRANPRRLMRALELAEAGIVDPPQGWAARSDVSLVGLEMDRALLNERIRQRVDTMYAAGLLDEVSLLLDRYPDFSSTAGQAIGYAEGAAVLRGECSREDAAERTVIRTRRLAKRQRTWFRTQLSVDWITVDERSRDDICDRVDALWERAGAVPLMLDAFEE